MFRAGGLKGARWFLCTHNSKEGPFLPWRDTKKAFLADFGRSGRRFQLVRRPQMVVFLGTALLLAALSGCGNSREDTPCSCQNLRGSYF
jgi:hypothetical protein